MKPEFDPSQPFEAAAKPAFDPSRPFEAAAPTQQHGASGSWGLPDPGLLGALSTKLNEGLTKKGSDELVGLFARGRMDPEPGRFLRLPDGSEMPARTPEEAQIAFRQSERLNQLAAEQHWPKMGGLASMTGEVAGDIALAGGKMVSPLYQAATGGIRGFLGSNSDDLAGKVAPTTFGALLGYGIGKLPEMATAASETPLAQAIASSRAGQMTGRALSSAASWPGEALAASGDKFKNLAGWLKVNSLHPTPTLAEAMADLPGGTPAVGRELLAQGVGGITKAGTAEQAAAAYGKAGAAIEDLAKYHDAAGGPLIDVTGAIAAGKAKAQKLIDEPTTEAVGRQMMTLVEKYEAKFAQGAGSAQEILGMKRALGDAAYGENEKLRRVGDKVAGKLGEGLSSFERATDDALDTTLGPRFEAANLLSRQMRGASQAAERSAGRQQGNGLLDLKSLLAGLATMGAGHFGGMPAAAGAGAMLLGTKYGSQMGARSLYGLGEALQSAPRLAQLMANVPSYAPAASSPLTSRWGASLADLLERPRQPYLSPDFAQEDH